MSAVSLLWPSFLQQNARYFPNPRSNAYPSTKNHQTSYQDLAKAGRIDFAIVGGVNLFGDEQLFHHLRRASMLSPSGRCHTFSAEADGYVRAEGGVLFLLAREALELPSHGRILGSAVTQNSRMGLACFKNGNSC